MFVNPQAPQQDVLPPEFEVAADAAVGGILPGQAPGGVPHLEELLSAANTGALEPEA